MSEKETKKTEEGLDDFTRFFGAPMEGVFHGKGEGVVYLNPEGKKAIVFLQEIKTMLVFV